jgi:hypothetical protein
MKISSSNSRKLRMTTMRMMMTIKISSSNNRKRKMPRIMMITLIMKMMKTTQMMPTLLMTNTTRSDSSL